MKIKLFTKELNKVPGNQNIISSLNKVNKNLTKKKINYIKVKKDYEKAYTLYMQKMIS